MATTSNKRSTTRPFQSSCNSATNTMASPFTSSFASSTAYHSASPSTGFFSQRRPVSPSRVNLNAPPPPAHSVRLSIIDRSISPRRSIRSQVMQSSNGINIQNKKRTCSCSPTSHPGSFRCALHKSTRASSSSDHSIPYSPNRLNMRRSAMTNSLVRIGTVEGDLMKRALAALIRPSSHQQRRHAGFQSRRSRLSVMSKADGGSHVK